MASVNSSGNAIAGEALTLTCSITRSIGEDTNGSLILQWMSPNGTPVMSMGPVVVGEPLTSGSTTSISLHFTTLFTSHGGQYTCLGDFVSENIRYMVSVLQDVFIQGNLLMHPMGIIH